MDEEMYVAGTPAFCYHCGKLTILRIRAEYTYTVNEENYVGKDDIRYIKWSMLQCLKCLKPTFMQSSEVSKKDSVNSRLWKRTTESIETLYPAEKSTLPYLPSTIERMYTEAIKVRNLSPSSCAVLVRRTLEAVCQHENASGRTLAQKLKHLADAGKIPDTLVDVATHLKQLGNLGAHFDVDNDITSEDVPMMLDFVELLLEYLYVAPTRIKAVKDRSINPRKSPSLVSSDENPF